MAEAPLSSQGAESGVVVEFVPSVNQPVVPSQIRVAALIGKGKVTKTVVGAQLTKGSADSIDTLLPAAASLPASITDQNLASYKLNVDYQLTSGNVDWSINGAASFTSTVDASGPGLAVSGLTFGLSVDNGPLQTMTFSGSNPLTQTTIITQLNAGFTGVTASASGNFIKIASNSTNNSSLLIGQGTADSILGFTGGLLAIGPKEPAPGVKYSFDYETPKTSADYAPTLFTSLDDVVTAYGPINTANTLSLGAQFVFTNSANTGAIIGVQLDPADTPDLTGFRNALNKLASVDGINIVVPLTGDPNLYSDVKQHVINSSAPLEKKERTAILGMQGNPSIGTASSYAAGLAAGGNGRRIMLVYPSSANATVAGNAVTLNGAYLAAAIAGVRINRNYDVAEPLLRKPLLGFDSIQTGLTRTNKLLLRNAGLTVIDTVDTVVRIVEDTTTDRTSPDTQEYSVTEIIDYVATTSRKLLDSIFIGIKLLPDTPNLIVATLNTILTTFVDLQIINSFGSIKSNVNALDPRQVDVSFEIQPTRPLRFIKVTFSI